MTRKIVMFSPLPPVPSGIASYTHALAEQLVSRGKYDLTVVVNQNWISVSPHYEIRHWKHFLYNPLPKDSVIVYQLGNNLFHEYIYPFLFSEPGITVLHDFILGHGRLQSLMQLCSLEEQLEELIYQLGPKEAEHLRQLIEHGVQGHHLPFAACLNRTVLEASLHTIVHNPDTEYVIKLKYPGVSIESFPMGLWEPERWLDTSDEINGRMRRELSISPKTFVLGTFGVVNPYKQIGDLLETVKELFEQRHQIAFVITGYLSPDSDVPQKIIDLGLQSCVRIISNATKRKYWNLVKMTDVCYSLRFPPAGEFSLSILEQMACGKPVVLNRHRFNSYIPEDVCVKIQNSTQKTDLIKNTKLLYANPEIRRSIGMRAKEYARSFFSMEKMVDGYAAAFDNYESYKTKWKGLPDGFPRHLRNIYERVEKGTFERFVHPMPVSLMNQIQSALLT